MSIAIPFPDGVIISNLTIAHNIPQFVTTSLNMKRRSKERGLHQLSGTFDVHLPDVRTQRKFESWLVKMRGRHNFFELSLGGRFDSSDHIRKEPTLATRVGIGSVEVAHNGMVGQVWEGDMFTFLNDRKIYVCTSDAKATGQNIKFYPACRIEHSLNEKLTFNNVVLSGMLDDDIQTISYAENGLIHTYTCAWKEYLE